MTDYMATLRRLRGLAAELAPWTDAFRDAHGRKPRLADVDAAAVPWLSSKFREYVTLRARVLNETAGLRRKLSSVQSGGSVSTPRVAAPPPSTTKSNIKPAPPPDIVKRLAAVEKYKKAARAAVTAAAAAQPPPAPTSRRLTALGLTTAPRVQAAVAAAIEYRASRMAAMGGDAPLVDTPPPPSNQNDALARALQELQEARADAAAAKARLEDAAAAAAAAAERAAAEEELD